jgi:hypothetical protein
VSEVPNVRGIIAFALRLHESLKTGVWFMTYFFLFPIGPDRIKKGAKK